MKHLIKKLKIQFLPDDAVMLKKLMGFKTKIKTMQEICGEDSEEAEKAEKVDIKEEVVDDILAHRILCEDKAPVLAKDANLKEDDWFEIHDPRNPINKRRRGETSKKGEGDRGKNRHPRT